jgi:sec-independent protein translocase protein TatB
MSSDLRNQSGIDDLIRQEGLEREIQELRSLSRMNVVDTLITPALTAPAASPRPYAPPKPPDFERTEPLREREYPLVGCDAQGALADDIVPPPQEAPSASPAAAEEPAVDAAAETKDAAEDRAEGAPA